MLLFCTPSITLRKRGFGEREREMIHFPHMLKGTAQDHYPQFEHANRHTHCLFQQTWILVNTCELKALYEITQTRLILISIHRVPWLCGQLLQHLSLVYYELPLFKKLLYNHHCFIKQRLSTRDMGATRGTQLTSKGASRLKIILNKK